MVDVDLLAYYYPQWHSDPVNDRLHQSGWTEWDLLPRQRNGGVARFPGHQPPGQPATGPADESDPQVAAGKVHAAADAGLTGFIIDWYWYRGAPFLNGFLDHGLLPALAAGGRGSGPPDPPGTGFRFALMWANHPWWDVFPAGRECQRVLLPAPEGDHDFDAITDHLIDRYLLHPSYWRLAGRRYFSIFDVPRLLHGFGSISRTRRALDRFRGRAVAAGADLHLNLCASPSMPNPAYLLDALGADSVTHHSWWMHDDSGIDGYPTSSYSQAANRARRTWRTAASYYAKPYLPNVTVGWDPTPRREPWEHDRWRGYPYTSVLAGRTPERFAAALENAIDIAPLVGPGAVTVNAWNEWTGGSYLEADEHGTPYLDEIRRLRATPLSASLGQAREGVPAWSRGMS